MVAERVPRLIAFDLDATLWYPEMYHLWGSGGAPFRPHTKNGNVIDRSGTEVYLMGASRKVLHELKTASRWKNTKVAFVSCTDEPSWAKECMELIDVGDNLKMKDCVDHVEIYKCNKREHFIKLHTTTGIPYSEMIFYDNEIGNIRSVTPLGVTCVYTPNGLNPYEWSRGLQEWADKQ